MEWLLSLVQDSLTASIGLSFANSAIFAKSSLRFSGGKMLSIHAWTLLPMPPNVPWRVPVRPLTTSAMFGEAVVCFTWYGRAGSEQSQDHRSGCVNFSTAQW